MSKINELIQTLCPDGVEYKKIRDVYTRLRGTSITAGKMKEIADENGDVRIFAGGKTVINAFEKDIPRANITRVPAVLVQSRGVIDFVYYDKPFTFKNEMWAYTHENTMSVQYLCYVLKNNAQTFRNEASGMGSMPQISLSVTEDFEIPIPPLPIQEEIVRILDEYTELEAELEAKLSEEIELKQKQYEYCASKLFEDLNVEYISMSELAKFKYGYTDKASDSGNARFIRITDIDDFGELSSADEKYITLTNDAEKYFLTKGSLVVARTGATYGKTLYFDSDEPSVYASFLIKIDFDNNQVLNRYYWHFTKTSLYWEQANKYVKVGGQQQFNSPALGRVCVPVPSLTEQERIVKILDKYDTYTRDMISALNTELESRKKQYAYYRDQLLTFKRKE